MKNENKLKVILMLLLILTSIILNNNVSAAVKTHNTAHFHIWYDEGNILTITKWYREEGTGNNI